MKRFLSAIIVLACIVLGATGCGSVPDRTLTKAEYSKAMNRAVSAHDARIESLDRESGVDATRTYRRFDASFTTMVDQIERIQPNAKAAQLEHRKLVHALQAQEVVLTEAIAIVSEGGVAQLESDTKYAAAAQKNTAKREAAVATLQKQGWLDQDFYIDD